MTIDIDTFGQDIRDPGLSIEDIRALNDITYKELRARYEQRAQELAKSWRVGDIVYFLHNGRVHEAKIERLNKRTVTAIGKDPRLTSLTKWRVAYSLCYKTSEEAVAAANSR